MKTKYITIILLSRCLILGGLSCSQNENTRNTNKMQSNELMVDNQIGIVGYWEEIGQYTINFSQINTIDSYVTGITTDLPEEFQEPGMKIVFSGLLSRGEETPKPMLGGQAVYFLKLKKIQKPAGTKPSEK